MAVFLGAAASCWAVDRAAPAVEVAVAAASAIGSRAADGGGGNGVSVDPRLKELAELQATMPSLSSPSTFVELAKAQRRARAIERDLAANPPVVARDSKSETLANAFFAFFASHHVLHWVLLTLIKVFLFAIVWWFVGSQDTAVVERRLVWPLGFVFGEAQASRDRLALGPVAIVALVSTGVSRATREVAYWRRARSGSGGTGIAAVKLAQKSC
eukprot:TRINITY_DN27291_c0_g1_i1.p1 TRINITY_DN27291_c0_g1~~TRINITY_DN27291_c0_g1_i1.p1  ORF type:complete len:214 (-),score=38.54 TRINITY_DN27291_c0_g1_i1:253-894(-)